MLLIAGLLSGCQSVQPIVKIGLIAPFEGLYRNSGYQALAGLRAAISSCSSDQAASTAEVVSPGEVVFPDVVFPDEVVIPDKAAVLPQALDDSADPQQAQRAAAKLAVDPAVIAIIGPLFPAVQPDSELVRASTNPAWLLPYSIDPTGRFTGAGSAIWLEEMGAYILQQVGPGDRAGDRRGEDDPARMQQGIERVLIVGLPTGVLPSWQGNEQFVRLDDPALALQAVKPGDGILWLGLPHQAAPWLHAAWQEQPELPFWLGTQSGAEVLAAHLRHQELPAQASGAAPSPTSRATAIHPSVYWLIWTDSEYNQWLEQHAPTDPAAYHIYRAACALLAPQTEPPHDVLYNGSDWQLQQQPLLPASD